jgi:hypothetical protein
MAISSFPLLGFAVTGEMIAGLEDVDSVDTFLSTLESLGWTSQRIQSLATDSWLAETAWPFPLPSSTLPPTGAAQWYALLAQVRARLNLDVVRRPPSPRTALTAEELRLTDDLPPHHGLV